MESDCGTSEKAERNGTGETSGTGGTSETGGRCENVNISGKGVVIKNKFVLLPLVKAELSVTELSVTKKAELSITKKLNYL